MEMNFTAHIRIFEFVRYTYSDKISYRMFSFEFFQNGLIFCSLAAGLLCLGHILFGRSSSCRNSWLTFSVIFTGFCNMLYCTYTLDITQTSLDIQIPRGGAPVCLDITFPGTLANACILTIIANHIIRRNIRNSTKSRAVQVIISGVIVIALVFKFLEDFGGNTRYKKQQEMFLSFQNSAYSRTEFFWSICQKRVDEELVGLISEYVLIYCPAFVVALVAWYKTCGQNSGLKIIKKGCLRTNGDPCFCSTLNSVFVAVLLYAFLLLFIARPAAILYAFLTSGLYRDIFLGLTSTVIYCFLCGEYLYRSRRVPDSDRNKSADQTSTESKIQIV